MAELNQRVAVTKRMVKEGLIRLLEKKSLEKINITELCQEAGINRTTFYRYYELPRDVLTEMQNEFYDNAIAHFQTPLTASDIEYFLRACMSIPNWLGSFSNTTQIRTGRMFSPKFIPTFPE